MSFILSNGKFILINGSFVINGSTPPTGTPEINTTYYLA